MGGRKIYSIEPFELTSLGSIRRNDPVHIVTKRSEMNHQQIAATPTFNLGGPDSLIVFAWSAFLSMGSFEFLRIVV